MADAGKLAGRVALITGGGGEIGGAIARRFAREGAKVCVADITLARAEAVAQTIAGAGGEAVPIEADVSDAASAEAAVADAISAFGRLTTLINVAAANVSAEGTVEVMPLDDWNRELGVNLTGAFLMCKYAVPQLRRAGGGAIVNIASRVEMLHL